MTCKICPSDHLNHVVALLKEIWNAQKGRNEVKTSIFLTDDAFKERGKYTKYWVTEACTVIPLLKFTTCTTFPSWNSIKYTLCSLITNTKCYLWCEYKTFMCAQY